MSRGYYQPLTRKKTYCKGGSRSRNSLTTRIINRTISRSNSMYKHSLKKQTKDIIDRFKAQYADRYDTFSCNNVVMNMIEFISQSKNDSSDWIKNQYTSIDFETNPNISETDTLTIYAVFYGGHDVLLFTYGNYAIIIQSFQGTETDISNKKSSNITLSDWTSDIDTNKSKLSEDLLDSAKESIKKYGNYNIIKLDEYIKNIQENPVIWFKRYHGGDIDMSNGLDPTFISINIRNII